MRKGKKNLPKITQGFHKKINNKKNIARFTSAHPESLPFADIQPYTTL